MQGVYCPGDVPVWRPQHWAACPTRKERKERKKKGQKKPS